VLRHAVNTDSDLGGAIGELFSGWMNAIGIDVQLDAYDQDQLYTVIVEGTYDTFYWGWVPFVDPDPMLSYFTEAELYNYNDANWTNPRFEELYLEQKEEVDLDRRIEIVHEMVRLIHDDAAYVALWFSPDLQAVRTDRFEGFVRQPAEVGPVIFSQSSPSYALIQPIGATDEEPADDETTEETTDGTTDDTDSTTPPDDGTTDESTTDDGATDGTGDDTADATDDDATDDDDGGNGVLIAVIIGAVVLLGAGGVLIAKRKGSADDRE